MGGDIFRKRLAFSMLMNFDNSFVYIEKQKRSPFGVYMYIYSYIAEGVSCFLILYTGQSKAYQQDGSY